MEIKEAVELMEAGVIMESGENRYRIKGENLYYTNPGRPDDWWLFTFLNLKLIHANWEISIKEKHDDNENFAKKIQHEGHTHDWQFVKMVWRNQTEINHLMPRWNMGFFICECGATKWIKMKDEDE